MVTGTSLGAQAPPGVYFVRARGRNACGTGPASPEPMVAVGCSGPGPGVAADRIGGTASQVMLHWNAAPGATDYMRRSRARRADAANVVTIPDRGARRWSRTAPAGTYYVRVRPRNACGSGWWSNEAVVTVGQ